MNTTPKPFEFVVTSKEVNIQPSHGEKFSIPSGKACRVLEINKGAEGQGPQFYAKVKFGEYEFWVDETEATVIMPNDNENPLRVYFISDFTKTPEGEFIPCIAVYGETGFYKTDWAWGNDKKIAQEICDEMNEKIGVHPDMARAVVLTSMRKAGR